MEILFGSKNEDRIDGEFFYHSFNGSFIQNFIKECCWNRNSRNLYYRKRGKRHLFYYLLKKMNTKNRNLFLSILTPLSPFTSVSVINIKKHKSRIDQKVFFFHEITNTLRRNVRMSIGDTERTTQNRVIDFFKNRNILDYKYIGNLKDTAKKNIREDRLRAYLRLSGYSERLIDGAVAELCESC